MPEVQLRTLRVSAEMDSSSYAAGARELVEASNEAGVAATGLGAAVDKMGTTVSQTPTKITSAANAAERLKRTYVEGYRASQDMEAALIGVGRSFDRGTLSANEASRAIEGIVRRYGVMANATQFAAKNQLELASAVEMANERLRQQSMMPANPIAPVVADNQNTPDRSAQYRRQNLGYQLFDVSQGAALGMSPAMILMQQGPQIAQLYAAQGGLNAAMKDFGTILAGVARYLGPVIVAGTALYGVYRLLQSNSLEAGLAVSDTTRALAAQASPIGSLQSSVAELAKIQNDYSQALVATQTAHSAASESIVANSEREFNAKKALLEIELKRQEASLALQQSEAAIAALHLRQEIGQQVTSDPGAAVRNGYADPSINGGIPFVRVPDSNVEKTIGVIENSPAAEKIKEISAQATLTEIAVNKLREGLKQVFNTGGDVGPSFPGGIPIPTPAPRAEYQLGGDDTANKSETAYQQLIRTASARAAQLQNEIAIMGQATEAQARLRAEFEAEAQYREQIARAGGIVKPEEIELLKQKAALVASLNQQLQAGKMLQDQQNEIQQLQLEANLVGATAEQRSRATAALQAEQQLRQQGIDLLSREGQQYKANAVAMAEARLQIERQNAAYQTLQTAGGSAIDALTVGTGSLKDRLKSAADTMLQWIQQLTIANPLKNALFGSNLPTMGDLFSGKPSIPGATSTGMMTVTAGTVMVNGGMAGGFPSMPGVTGTPGSLGGVLGLPAAANSNVVNGVRPDLTGGGIVNSPVAAAAANPGTQAMMYRQAISQIESGSYAGNYNAIGPVTRTGDQAIGRYQVMGANVPSWSEKYYGQKLTPEQFRANPAAQDAVFDGEFGSYATKYGGGGAATKWFTGSSVATGKTDVNGMSDTRYSQQFNTNMQKLSQTTASTSKDLGSLGDTSSKVGTQITDGIGKLATPAAAPQVPAVAPTATAGSNPFAALFGGFFKLLGFADGTDNSPGGLAWVGERGKELVNLPRGSQVTPTHKLNQVVGQRLGGGGRTKVDVGVSIDDDGKLRAYVKNISEETSVATTSAGIAAYDSELPNRIENYRQNPHNRGGM